MENDSVSYQFITKMNEAKTMRVRWLDLYDEIDELVRQMNEEDVRFLFKHIYDRVMLDIVSVGLAECWAESMESYTLLNPDEEMPLVENQESWYLECILNEIELMNRNRDESDGTI